MKILVTGGGGFLGFAICVELKKRGYEVGSFSRGAYGKLDKLGVKSHQGDITSLDDVKKSIAGYDAVIHTAAKAGFWGAYQSYYGPNVVGTQNILQAMKELQIPYLVHTSSPSVVIPLDGVEGGDETLPYPKNFLSSYPETKKLGELAVLQAVSNDLKAIVLRPHIIWGPGDPHFLPRIIKGAKKFRVVGQGTNLVDVIYVDNAAVAHVDGLEKLIENPSLNGRIYFLAQEHPVVLWEFLNKLLATQNLPPIKKSISYPAAYALGGLCEALYRFAPSHLEPPMSRYLASSLAKSHYFSHENAKRDLGFIPRLSVEEGLKRLS